MKAHFTAARGFSLIELLVVVSIIVILVALILPSLGSVRNSAVAAQCESNLHQLMLAYGQRRVDVKSRTKDRLTHAFGWKQALVPYVGGESSVLNCPMDIRATGGATVSSYYLKVYSGSNFLYDMPLEAGPLTIYIDKHTTDTGIMEEVDPDITASELGQIPANGFRLYFEDLRPHGGDRDFRDVILEIVETGDGKGATITYIQDAAGYTFDLVGPDGIIWENMDNGGKTKPGPSSTVPIAGGSSYGMNEAVEYFHKGYPPTDPNFQGTGNPIFIMDYQKQVIEWGMVGRNGDVDEWDDWASDQLSGLPQFARHADGANALMADGSVAPSLDTSTIDPLLLQNVELYWAPQ